MTQRNESSNERRIVELKDELERLREEQDEVCQAYLRRAWQSAELEPMKANNTAMVERVVSLLVADFDVSRDEAKEALLGALDEALGESFDAGVYQTMRAYAGASGWQPSWVQEARETVRRERANESC